MSEQERSVSERIKAAMQNQACTDDLARVNRSPDDCPVGCPIHSGCNCNSGNNPDGKRPAFMVERDGRLFGIDACIAPAVQALWAAGIKTVNSCCGHNSFAPWIVLGDGEEIYDAAKVVRAVDSRLFNFDFARHPIGPCPTCPATDAKILVGFSGSVPSFAVQCKQCGVGAWYAEPLSKPSPQTEGRDSLLHFLTYTDLKALTVEQLADRILALVGEGITALKAELVETQASVVGWHGVFASVAAHLGCQARHTTIGNDHVIARAKFGSECISALWKIAWGTEPEPGLDPAGYAKRVITGPLMAESELTPSTTPPPTTPVRSMDDTKNSEHA